MFNDFEVRPSRTRSMTLENGNILNMTATDPYGFIYFSLEHGQLPQHLKGAGFTDWSQAEIAAKKYFSERQNTIAEIVIKEDKETKKAK